MTAIHLSVRSCVCDFIGGMLRVLHTAQSVDGMWSGRAGRVGGVRVRVRVVQHCGAGVSDAGVGSCGALRIKLIMIIIMNDCEPN